MKAPLEHETSNGTRASPTLQTNGHTSPIATNGHTNNNGNSATNGSRFSEPPQAEAGPSGTAVAVIDKDLPAWPAIGTKLPRHEVVRVIMQGLQEMGYSQAAVALQQEAGFPLDSTGDVTEFRRSVLEGDWATVESLLDAEETSFQTRGPGQGSLQIMSMDHLQEAKFLVAQQKYLELLEMGNQQRALVVLRNEVNPLASAASRWSPRLPATGRTFDVSPVDENMTIDRLGLLSSLLCSGPEALYARSGWPGVEGGTRIRLLDDMKDLIPPSHMLPPYRLAHLLTQAQNLQRLSCLYHVSETPMSLLRDHVCSRASFPSVTTQILRAHTDEVWRVEWSRDGKYLATGGKDKKAVVWRCFDGPSTGTSSTGGGTLTFQVEHVFDGHESGVTTLCWDHTADHLVTASDCEIRIFDVAKKTCISTIAKHDYEVSVLCTLADGSAFVSGAMDQTIHCWKFNGDHLWSWAVPLRILDLAISPDGRYILGVGFAWETRHAGLDLDGASPNHASSSGAGGGSGQASVGVAASATAQAGVSGVAAEKVQKLMFGNLADRTTRILDLRRDVTCVRVSSDSKSALVNFAPNDIGLYSIETMMLIQTYVGQRQVNGNIIQSCFGGVENSCVLSGSEDGNVYVWHRNSAHCIAILSGHKLNSIVNSVAWKPESGGDKPVFVSAGDDHTVRVWQAPDSSILPASVTDRIEASQLKWW